MTQQQPPHAESKREELTAKMEPVTKKNLVNQLLAREIDTQQMQRLDQIKKSQHPEIQRMLDLSVTLAQSTLQATVQIADN